MATETTKTTASAPKKATATKKAAPKKAAPKVTPLRERDLKVLTVEAGYAAASLADEAVSFARELPAKADKLRTKVTADTVKSQVKELASDAQEALTADKVKETVTGLASSVTKATKDLRAEAPAKLKELRADTLVKDAKGNFATYRAKVGSELDERAASFQKHFDARVKAGKKVVTEVKANEQVKNVLGQAKTASTKVKDVVTSVRKSA